MLRRLNELEGYAIGATDGALGEVTDFLFDDNAWVVRYLVVRTGRWLSNRNVLISPIAIGEPDWNDRVLRVPMTTEQVRNSPDVDTVKPVEATLHEHYRRNGYWADHVKLQNPEFRPVEPVARQRQAGSSGFE